MSGKPLSPKQRRFISEYLKDENGTQAAIRAGYSPKTAQEQSSDLLSKPMVRAAVDAALKKIHDDAAVTKERILKALLNVAELDPRQLFNKDGTLKSMDELPDEIALSIASIESDDAHGDVKKLKFWDKVRALELLGKHLKLFDEPATGSAVPMVINIVPANTDKRDTSH